MGHDWLNFEGSMHMLSKLSGILITYICEIESYAK